LSKVDIQGIVNGHLDMYLGCGQSTRGSGGGADTGGDANGDGDGDGNGSAGGVEPVEDSGQVGEEAVDLSEAQREDEPPPPTIVEVEERGSDPINENIHNLEQIKEEEEE
jgi:hypothetical protein